MSAPNPTGATTTERAGRVVVVGNLTIDDVVRPDGRTIMGALGGNAIHSATAVLACGVPVSVVARKGEDFPPEALDTLTRAGADLSGVAEVAGPTVRNWVVYESDGRRHWLYRTPLGRSAEVAPEAVDVARVLHDDPAVVHVAAMPLANAERVVAEVRRRTPSTMITLDTHEDWGASVRERVLELAKSVDLFEPSLEELCELTASATAADGLRALADAGLRSAVVKAGADGAYVLDDSSIRHVPAFAATVVDTTGAGDAFCGGVAAGLALGLDAVGAVGLGVVTAGTAIGSSGSLRLLDRAGDPADLLERGRVAVMEGRNTAVAGVPVGSVSNVTDVADPDPFSIDVMRREIDMMPAVVSDAIDDPDGHLFALAKSLLAQNISDLWLTGCGDSAFAGQAASLAFYRHTGIRAHPVHALDLSRYQVRYLPTGSAVVGVSVSGQVGRTVEAAVQARRFGYPTYALTNAVDGKLALASDVVVPLDVTTLGFSPGTSTYVAMLGSLLRVAAAVSELSRGDDTLSRMLHRLPAQVASTLEVTAEPAVVAAQRLLARPWTAFLGAGPNEATARFGAAKVFEGSQQVAVSTNLEEWAHEEYFVTSAGDPVVLVNPTGAAHDRGLEILSELRFVDAMPIVVSDQPLPSGSARDVLLLPLSPDVPEELSPVTSALPLALAGFHLARLGGKRSYDLPSEEARTEHYDTIHRATIGEPA